MENHAIICGFGTVGMYACDELIKEIPCLVIDNNHEVSRHLEELEIPCIIGDATKTSILKKAQVENAKILVAALGDDIDNVLIVLTARSLNKNLVIASRTHRKETMEKMKKSGANIVVMPEVVGGEIITKETMRNIIFKP